MTDFLQKTNQLFNKKREKINKNKWKIYIREIILKKAIIKSLNSSDKEKLPVLILETKKSGPKANNTDKSMVDIDIYCATCYLKRANVLYS